MSRFRSLPCHLLVSRAVSLPCPPLLPFSHSNPHRITGTPHSSLPLLRLSRPCWRRRGLPEEDRGGVRRAEDLVDPSPGFGFDSLGDDVDIVLPRSGPAYGSNASVDASGMTYRTVEAEGIEHSASGASPPGASAALDEFDHLERGAATRESYLSELPTAVADRRLSQHIARSSSLLLRQPDLLAPTLSGLLTGVAPEPYDVFECVTNIAAILEGVDTTPSLGTTVTLLCTTPLLQRYPDAASDWTVAMRRLVAGRGAVILGHVATSTEDVSSSADTTIVVLEALLALEPMLASRPGGLPLGFLRDGGAEVSASDVASHRDALVTPQQQLRLALVNAAINALLTNKSFNTLSLEAAALLVQHAVQVDYFSTPYNDGRFLDGLYRYLDECKTEIVAAAARSVDSATSLESLLRIVLDKGLVLPHGVNAESPADGPLFDVNGDVLPNNQSSPAASPADVHHLWADSVAQGVMDELTAALPTVSEWQALSALVRICSGILATNHNSPCRASVLNALDTIATGIASLPIEAVIPAEITPASADAAPVEAARLARSIVNTVRSLPVSTMKTVLPWFESLLVQHKTWIFSVLKYPLLVKVAEVLAVAPSLTADSITPLCLEAAHRVDSEPDEVLSDATVLLTSAVLKCLTRSAAGPSADQGVALLMKLGPALSVAISRHMISLASRADALRLFVSHRALLSCLTVSQIESVVNDAYDFARSVVDLEQRHNRRDASSDPPETLYPLSVEAGASLAAVSGALVSTLCSGEVTRTLRPEVADKIIALALVVLKGPLNTSIQECKLSTTRRHVETLLKEFLRSVAPVGTSPQPVAPEILETLCQVFCRYCEDVSIPQLSRLLSLAALSCGGRGLLLLSPWLLAITTQEYTLALLDAKDCEEADELTETLPVITSALFSENEPLPSIASFAPCSKTKPNGLVSRASRDSAVQSIGVLCSCLPRILRSPLNAHPDEEDSRHLLFAVIALLSDGDMLLVLRDLLEDLFAMLLKTHCLDIVSQPDVAVRIVAITLVPALLRHLFVQLKQSGLSGAVDPDDITTWPFTAQFVVQSLRMLRTMNGLGFDSVFHAPLVATRNVLDPFRFIVDGPLTKEIVEASSTCDEDGVYDFLAMLSEEMKIALRG